MISELYVYVSIEREKYLCMGYFKYEWFVSALIVTMEVFHYTYYCIGNENDIQYTLPKTDITPEHGPSQKDTGLQTIHFGVQCSFQGGCMYRCES